MPQPLVMVGRRAARGDALCRPVECQSAFAVVAAGVNATNALVFSQVILSIALPVPMISLITLTSRRDIMGDYVTGRLVGFLAFTGAATVPVLNGVLLLQIFGIQVPGWAPTDKHVVQQQHLTTGCGPRPKNVDFPLPKVLLPCHHDGDGPAVAVRQMTAFSCKLRFNSPNHPYQCPVLSELKAHGTSLVFVSGYLSTINDPPRVGLGRPTSTANGSWKGLVTLKD